MSTTAGLGSTDYVEVNATAIAALVLGLASAVLLFNQPLLLVIPAAGIVTAIIAFRQIGKSNGTQTGRILAVAAIALSLLFGGIVAARTFATYRQANQDKAQIASVVVDFRDRLKVGDFNGMYVLFDDRFRQRVPPEQFADMMKYISGSDLYGKVKSVMLPGMPPDAPKGYPWKGIAEFMPDEANGETMATAQLIFAFEKVGENRQQVWFRKKSNQWVFDDIPGMFPRPKQGEPGGPGGPGGGPPQ